MKLQLTRKNIVDKDTLFGKLRITDETGNLIYTANTLENVPRETKIPGLTAIPAGTYKIRWMTYNTPMHLHYKNRYDFNTHGMIHLLDVPNFEQIYIHIGNYLKDTDGCILVGKGVDIFNKMITQSTRAYQELYEILKEASDRGEEITITITDGVY